MRPVLRSALEPGYATVQVSVRGGVVLLLSLLWHANASGQAAQVLDAATSGNDAEELANLLWDPAEPPGTRNTWTLNAVDAAAGTQHH